MDSFHLLDNHFFYPVAQNRKMTGSPHLRKYTPESAPTLRIPADEEWFYRHFPALQLMRTPFGKVRVTAKSASLVLNCLRFTPEGLVAYMHPKLAMFLCKFFVCARLGSDVTISVLKAANVFTGSWSVFRYEVASALCDRWKKSLRVSLDGCCFRGCQTPTDKIHPKSFYIFGCAVCSACLTNALKGDTADWISSTQLESWFSNGVRDTTMVWRFQPIRYILVGIVAAETLTNTTNLTLQEYARIGRDFIEWPIDRIFWSGVSGSKVRLLSEVADIVSWRHMQSVVEHSRKFESRGSIAGIFRHDNFQFFGWQPIPSGGRPPPPEFIGPLLKSIDHPDNDPKDYPLRVITIEASRRVLMKGSTYIVWRKLFLGADVSIKVASEDYEPMVHGIKFDARYAPPTRIPPGDFAVYHAESLTWGALARYLSMLCENNTLHLYGSLRASVAGQQPNVREGVFAELLFTFRYLETLPKVRTAINVTTHDPGPELIPLVPDSLVDVEADLVKSRPLLPSFPKQFKPHAAWGERMRMPLLMCLLEMRPVQKVQFPPEYLTPIVIKPKRKFLLGDLPEP